MIKLTSALTRKTYADATDLGRRGVDYAERVEQRVGVCESWAIRSMHQQHNVTCLGHRIATRQEVFIILCSFLPVKCREQCQAASCGCVEG